MREILFKAKKKDNGEWVEGCLVIDQSRPDIFKYRIQPIKSGVLYAAPINPDTLCQYTGLTDKNGNKIWENDIVKRNFYLYSSEAKYEERENCGIVKYDKEYARFGYQCSVFAMLSESKKHDTIEVIGNIFDNKKLLESEEK